jgi:hypothetical protein
VSDADANAKLVESMIDRSPWKDQPWARMALAVAARTIRRGRHLTEAEQLRNLAAAMDEADAEHGEPKNSGASKLLRQWADAQEK